METDLTVGLLAMLVAIYSMFATRLMRWWISAPFAFLVIGVAVGLAEIDLLDQATDTSALLGGLAELTLALVLFGAASTIRVRRLEHDTAIVGRLLVLGLPLTIALGAALALGLFPGISFGLALLIGATLAPTDADLGHPVIADGSVPARVRRVLNAESGLNDGIVAPVITIAIALAIGETSGLSPLSEATFDLVVAAVVGLTVGGGGRWLLRRAIVRESPSRPTSSPTASTAVASSPLSPPASPSAWATRNVWSRRCASPKTCRTSSRSRSGLSSGSSWSVTRGSAWTTPWSSSMPCSR